MTVKLRDYQVEAVNSVFSAWGDGHRRVAIIIATGGGKTVTFSEIIRAFREEHQGFGQPQKVLVLAHRTELIEQAAATIRRLQPHLSVGVVQGSLNQVHADVIVASQQTIRTEKRISKLPPVGLVVVDECHRVPSATYARTLDMLRVNEPDGPLLLGVTATFTREDNKSMSDHFDHVAFRLDVVDLIGQGHLVDVKFKRVLVEGLDLTKVNTTKIGKAKDLEVGSLAAVMEEAGAFGVVAEAYVRYASDRQGLVFTPTVESAEHCAEALNARGISARAVAGTTSRGERKAILARFAAGELQVVVNCAVLTEGFDMPATSCVVLARPTYSGTLFRQMVGRALRPAPDSGKTDALVLDLVGSTGRNELRGPEDLVDQDVRGWDEGETLVQAVKRRVAQAAAERAEREAAEVSGSLAAVELQPWAVLNKAGMVKDPKVVDDEKPEETEPKEREEKEPVPEPPPIPRHGWMLESPGGHRFIPVKLPNGLGESVVFIATTQRHGHLVVQSHPMVGMELVGRFDSSEDAEAELVSYSIHTAKVAQAKTLIDPSARWRKNPVSPGARSFAARFWGHELADRCSRAGHAADLISLGQWSDTVDALAEKILAQSGSL